MWAFDPFCLMPLLCVVNRRVCIEKGDGPTFEQSHAGMRGIGNAAHAVGFEESVGDYSLSSGAFRQYSVVDTIRERTIQPFRYAP